ncbi:DUF2637 domain-containing protein [Marinactinospora rubrisoli]|uniref:DUF2637 domain-containing protein n=1 Tax=Marinactinospora rubrisoli TaxID=2715399 RepID=A0ABW2K915_9ACTN
MAPHTSPTRPGARPAPRKPRTGSRAVAIALTGLGVLVIAACAILLSYNGIYQTALQGNVDPRAAHLYPGVFTLLLLLAFWTTYLLRDAPRRRRIWVDVLILGLILLSAGASTLHALGYRLVETAAVVVVALAPWAALLVAFRIWLWVIVHLRGERAPRPRSRGREKAEPANGAPPGDGEDDGATGVSDRSAAPVESGRTAAVPAKDDEQEEPAPAASREPSPEPDRPAPGPPAPRPDDDGPSRVTGPLFRPAASGPEPPAAHAAIAPGSTSAGEPAEPATTGPENSDRAPELPRRVPTGPANPIKRAAMAGPEDASVAPGSTTGAATGNDAPAGPEEDAAETVPAETGPADVPTEPQRPFVLPRKRPMVRKPRHNRADPASGKTVPPEPPSWRVRSEPLPPQDD